MTPETLQVRSGLPAGRGVAVLEIGKPIARVARELGINEGTLGNWIARQRRARDGAGRPLSHDERAELDSLRKENAELRMHLQDAGSVDPTPDPPSTTPAHSHPSEGEAGVMPRLAGSGRINRGPEPCRGRS